MIVRKVEIDARVIFKQVADLNIVTLFWVTFGGYKDKPVQLIFCRII